MLFPYSGITPFIDKLFEMDEAQSRYQGTAYSFHVASPHICQTTTLWNKGSPGVPQIIVGGQKHSAK